MLDEATSALDTATERQVTELIAQYQCTKVVVAHRLSTVRNAENIVVMEDGHIIQSGRHDDLMMVEGALPGALFSRRAEQPGGVHLGAVAPHEGFSPRLRFRNVHLVAHDSVGCAVHAGVLRECFNGTASIANYRSHLVVWRVNYPTTGTA